MVAVNGEESALWSAVLDERTLVLTVPESAGCTIDPTLSGVDDAAKVVHVEATSVSDGECAANLFLAAKELTVGTDVRGYAVHVRFDAG